MLQLNENYRRASVCHPGSQLETNFEYIVIRLYAVIFDLDDTKLKMQLSMIYWETFPIEDTQNVRHFGAFSML